jgi:hypothetical protein
MSLQGTPPPKPPTPKATSGATPAQTGASSELEVRPATAAERAKYAAGSGSSDELDVREATAADRQKWQDFSTSTTAASGPEPTWMDRLEAGYPGIGALLGGTIGMFGGGPGGRIIGAGVGGAAGKVVADVSHRIRMGPEAAGPPPTMADVVRAGGEGAASQTIGEGIGLGLGKVVKGLAPKMTPEGQEALDVFGGHLTPAQATHGPLLTVAENVARGGVFSHGTMDAFDADTTNIARSIAAIQSKQFGPSQAAGTTGTGVQQAIEAAHEAAGAEGSALYNDLWKGPAAGLSVELAPFQTRSAQLQQQLGPQAVALRGGATPRILAAGTPSDEAAGISANLPPEVAAVGKKLGIPIATLTSDPKYARMVSQLVDQYGVTLQSLSGDAMPFEQAHHLRSALGNIIGKAQASGDKYTGGIASQLYKTLTESMMEAGGGPGGQVWQAYDAAGKNWKDLNDTFQRGILDKMVSQGAPKSAIRVLFGSDDPAEITKAITTLNRTNPTAVQSAQRAFMDNVIIKRRTGMDPRQWDMASGKEMLDTLTQYHPTSVAAAIGPGPAQDLFRFARALEYMQTQGSGIGKLAIQFSQAGPLLHIMTGAGLGAGIEKAKGEGVVGMAEGALTGAGAVMITPYLVSKILTSEVGRNFLINGMRASAQKDFPTLRKATAGLVQFLAQSGLLLADDKPIGSGLTAEQGLNPNAPPPSDVPPPPGPEIPTQLGPAGKGRSGGAGTPPPATPGRGRAGGPPPSLGGRGGG